MGVAPGNAAGISCSARFLYSWSIATRVYLTSRTRHIHLRDLYVRELVKNGEVEIRYMASHVISNPCMRRPPFPVGLLG